MLLFCIRSAAVLDGVVYQSESAASLMVVPTFLIVPYEEGEATTLPPTRSCHHGPPHTFLILSMRKVGAVMVPQPFLSTWNWTWTAPSPTNKFNAVELWTARSESELLLITGPNVCLDSCGLVLTSAPSRPSIAAGLLSAVCY
jgi:hypothetical protein